MAVEYSYEEIEVKGSKIPLILLKDENVENVFITANFKYGRAREEIVESAHLIEHLTLLRTKKFPEIDSIRKEITDVGGVSGAFTSDEATTYQIKIPSDHLEIGMETITDIVFSPKLEKEDMEKAKDAIRVELGKRKRDDRYTIGVLLIQASFEPGSQGYRTMIDDRLKSLDNIKHEDILEIYNSEYNLDNCFFVIGGNFNKEELKQTLIKKIEEKFIEKERKNIGRKEVKRRQEKLERKEEMTSEWLALEFQAPSINQDLFYPTRILRFIMGDNINSRVTNRMRTKEGLSYSTYTQYIDTVNQGRFCILTDTKKGQTEKTKEIILEELRKVLDEGITQKEVDDAKKAMIGRTKIRDGNSNITTSAMKYYVEAGRMITPKEDIENLEKVTLEQVMQAAKEIFKLDSYSLAKITSK